MQSIAAPSDERQPATSQRRTLRIAWLVLLVLFAVFVLLLTWSVSTLRHFYTTATIPREATLIARSQPEWIIWQPVDRTIGQGVADRQAIAEGDSVRIVQSSGYGQVASISFFEQSQIDLWAGADLTIEELRTTRWNNHSLEVVLRQAAGYARYDIVDDQPYEHVRYIVHVGSATVELEPGGSYSIELRNPERQVLILGADPFAMEIDVAVRNGTALIHGANGTQAELRTGQRIEIDPAGIPGVAVPARWELIRDGGFTAFSEREYNNTTNQQDVLLPRADTWQVYSGPQLDEGQGYFRLSYICRPPQTNSACVTEDRRVAAWFYRSGGQTIGFTTGIEQRFGSAGQGIDVSEYRSLVLSFWVRVLYQSLEGAGERGTECPVMLRITARQQSPADPDEERVICVYVAGEDYANDAPPVRSPEVTYIQVEPADWDQISFDLRSEEWLPDYRFLRSIQIYANGHDYDSRVAEVSLIGTQ
jgi:hypothetical protein